MTLHDFGATYLIIVMLIFAFSGALGKMFWNGSVRDCYQANQVLLESGAQGPLRVCE